MKKLTRDWDFFRSNPMGSVVNADGSTRIINDLSFPVNATGTPSVNSMVNKHDFDTTWDEFEAVARYMREKKEPVSLEIFDWKSAYRQVPTSSDQWKYLMIKDFEGGLWMDTRVAFGGVAGCGTFGRVADVWKEIVRRLLKIERLFRWVDDVMIVKVEGDTFRLEDVVAISKGLGVKTNLEKLSDFADEQKYLGFIWNGVEKTVRLPEHKLNREKS